MMRARILVFSALVSLTPLAARADDASSSFLTRDLPTVFFAPDRVAAPDQPEQQTPAAAGEATAKPTRGFFSSLVHNLGDDVKHIARPNSLYFLAGGSAAALAVHPADSSINAHLAGDAADGWFTAGKYIGETPTLLAAGLTMYIIGRSGDKPRLMHLGMDEIEAQILATGIVEIAKVSIRRDRPVLPEGETQASGFSMPSGHAAATFAAATVLQQHLGYKAGIPTYLVATYVAMSRLHDNRHFASDVVMGATVGIIVGRSVTWHGRNFYASPQLLPGGGAIMVSLKP